jgi:hypothetical protein
VEIPCPSNLNTQKRKKKMRRNSKNRKREKPMRVWMEVGIGKREELAAHFIKLCEPQLKAAENLILHLS